MSQGMLWWLSLRSLGSRPLARELAVNQSLPRPLLWWLAPRRWDIRAAVAANPRCPRLLMRMMSLSSLPAVNAALAANPAASRRLLGYLALNCEPGARMCLAANPALTPALAERLLSDPNPFVRGVAAAHPAVSVEALTKLADGMTQPAWILNRIAHNPSCPVDLSDQLLTWIALGGTGDADPTFDPIECIGHPGDTATPAIRWYLDRAKQPRAEKHPLWRVRALVLSANQRLPSDRTRMLARDPRPEVRRSIASAQRLSNDIRLELRRDAEPTVARAAIAAAQRGNDRRVSGWLPRWGWVAGPAIFFTSMLPSIFSPRPPVTTVPPAQVASGVFITGLDHTTVLELPGSGTLTCGDVPVLGAVVAQISAGDRRLTMRTTGSFITIDGNTPGGSQATVLPGTIAEFRFLSGPSPLTVTAPATSSLPAVVVNVGKCGQ